MKERKEQHVDKGQILVVDNNSGIRELLRDCLENNGYTVQLAENALEAINLVKENQFSLVLSEISLPDIDGISLAKLLLTSSNLAHGNSEKKLSIIMMSNNASIASAIDAIRIGVREVIEKPIQVEKLLSFVDKHISKSKVNNNGEIENISEMITLDLNLSIKYLKESLERHYFIYQLNKQGGNITKVADVSGVDRAHLYRKFKLLGIKIK